MNRQQWKERLPLIEAYVNGETIQYRFKGERDNLWGDTESPEFNTECEYRIKPKPREWWINVYDGGREYDCLHRSKETADSEAADDRLECVHVREVVE